MARGILLDSSVVIPHLRGRLNLREIAADDEPLFLPLTVVGELYKGSYKSLHVQKNMNLLKAFLRTVAVLYLDDVTAQLYGQIASDLEKNGTPLPQNDIWIASLAIEYSLPLATRDAHFEKVTDLRILRW